MCFMSDTNSVAHGQVLQVIKSGPMQTCSLRVFMVQTVLKWVGGECWSWIGIEPLCLTLSEPHISFTGCDASFKIRYRLREHMRSHTQERLVACPTCGSMFSSNTKLFDHLHRQAEPIGEGLFIISTMQIDLIVLPVY